MHQEPETSQALPNPPHPVAPQHPNRLPAWLIRPANSFLRIELPWTTFTASLVFLSYLLNLGAVLPWIGLALECLPFSLRLARDGIRELRTPFDLPMVLLLAGAVVGFCVSDNRTISLGALQCILAVTLFYYSWVNSPAFARLIKNVIISLALIFLVVSVLYLLGVSIIDGRPNLEILGPGTHHGFAMYLAAEAAVLLGIAAFDTRKRTRLLAFGLFLIFLVIVVVWTRDSLNSLFGGVSVSSRWEDIWKPTAELLGDSPITGLGLGCWALARWETTALGTSEINGITHAHNAYLELYSNTGIVGALALLAALAIGLKLSLDIIRSPRTHPWYGFGIGVILACITTLVVGLVESAPVGVPLVATNTYYYVISPIAWLLCGLLVIVHRLITKDSAQRNERQQNR